MDIDSAAFDIGSLANIEETLYTNGYQDGFDHGRIHGLIEGRAIGREKGFQMWEEVGFYEGTALFWKAICETQDGSKERVIIHINHLLELISQFPVVNPSTQGSLATQDVDVAKLLSQIRTRYKMFCSSVGIRPRLRAANSGADIPDGGASAEVDNPRRGKVWKLNPGPATIADVASGF